MQNPNGSSDPKLLHSELTEKIIGVYYDVYNEVGHGFLESVYSNCMRVALNAAGLSVQREVPIPVYFRGIDVGQFKADLVVEGCILIELKAVQNLDRSHEPQIMNCLRGTELEIGCCSISVGISLNSDDLRSPMKTKRSAFIRVHPR